MRVRAVDIDWNYLAADIEPFVSKSQTFITTGVEYEVHALSVYRRVVFVLIVDDTKNPAFIPSLLFETLSTDIPADWMCNLIGESGVDLVIGPGFVAQDLEAYSSMIDQETNPITRFWQRIENG